MRTSRSHTTTLVAGLMFCWTATPAQAQLGTVFTYQGHLKKAGNPVNEACYFEFGLCDDPWGGNQIGQTRYVPDVEVREELFTVLLNEGGEVGAEPFDGQPRWLEVTVEVPPDPLVILSPRQELTPTPHAFYAEAAPWSGLTGNGGTTPGTHFLGTTDDVPFELHVNDATALRIEPDPTLTCPSLIGGWGDDRHARRGRRHD